MKRMIILAFAAVMALSIVSCAGSGRKSKEEVKNFNYPEWFQKGSIKTYSAAHCISIDQPEFVKHYNKDVSLEVFVDKKTGKDMLRVYWGDRTYEYEILEAKENAGRLMAPVKQEYKRFHIRGLFFEVYMQHALDITDSTRVRPEGFWVDLKDQKVMASTAEYNGERGKWGSMLLIK